MFEVSQFYMMIGGFKVFQLFWKRLKLILLFGTIISYADESSADNDVGKLITI